MPQLWFGIVSSLINAIYLYRDKEEIYDYSYLLDQMNWAWAIQVQAWNVSGLHFGKANLDFICGVLARFT